MIPIRDDIRTRETPVVNYLLIAMNVLVFLLMVTMSDTSLEAFFYEHAMIPANYTDGSVSFGDVMDIFTSMFMHAGLAHIGGNMLYLWIFGDNVEDRVGHGRYLIFYLVGGLVADVAHFLTDPYSTIPTVGASGAIAAVLGAYLIYFPGSQIATFIPLPLGIFYKLTMLPAAVVLGFWFVFQLFDGVAALGGGEASGVAYWAHIGGFVAGILMAKLLPTESRRQEAYAW
jgi:membrane associated rhomboid family serine protease